MRKTTLVASLSVSSMIFAAIACSSQDPGVVINNSGGDGGLQSSSGTSSSSSSSSSSSGSSSGSSSSSSSSSGSSSGASSGSSSGSTDGGSEGGAAGAYGTTCTTAGTGDPACTGTYNLCANDQGGLKCTKACTYPAGATGPQPDPADCPNPPTTGDCTPNSFCK